MKMCRRVIAFILAIILCLGSLSYAEADQEMEDIKNPETKVAENAIMTKEVSRPEGFGENEFQVDLKLEARDKSKGTVDISVVYDSSQTMKVNEKIVKAGIAMEDFVYKLDELQKGADPRNQANVRIVSSQFYDRLKNQTWELRPVDWYTK